jgi:uncharacterized membrane protein YphA (DoxX/SURF4 family)
VKNPALRATVVLSSLMGGVLLAWGLITLIFHWPKVVFPAIVIALFAYAWWTLYKEARDR